MLPHVSDKLILNGITVKAGAALPKTLTMRTQKIENPNTKSQKNINHTNTFNYLKSINNS
jgi:hypothetical protein